MIANKDQSKSIPISHLGPSPDQWIVATAKITKTIEISALHQSGVFFHHKQTLDGQSLDLLEYDHNKSHIHKVDGDERMVKFVADKFLELPFVHNVYSYRSNGRLFYMIIVSEDRDDMSFQLATVKIDALDDKPDFDFEIRYITVDRFNTESIPKTAVDHAGR